MTAVRSLALTRLALLGTLSRNAGEGGPSPHGSVGEGIRQSSARTGLHG
jgi:hypothetical protein